MRAGSGKTLAVSTVTTKPKQKRAPKFFKWVVEFQVDQSWVADGFDPDNEDFHAMLARRIGGAYNHELRARVLAAPAANLVRKVQGYES